MGRLQNRLQARGAIREELGIKGTWKPLPLAYGLKSGKSLQLIANRMKHSADVNLWNAKHEVICQIRDFAADPRRQVMLHSMPKKTRCEYAEILAHRLARTKFFPEALNLYSFLMVETKNKKFVAPLLNAARAQTEEYNKVLTGKEPKGILINKESIRSTKQLPYARAEADPRHPPLSFFNPKSIEVLGKYGTQADLEVLETVRARCGEDHKKAECDKAIAEIFKRNKLGGYHPSRVAYERSLSEMKQEFLKASKGK